jgi:uncharacterized protein (DUF362 family)
MTSNVLVAGTDPAAIDAVVSRLMGFNPEDLPIVNHSFQTHRWPIATSTMKNIRVFDGRFGREATLDELAPAVKPHLVGTIYAARFDLDV